MHEQANCDVRARRHPFCAAEETAWRLTRVVAADLIFRKLDITLAAPLPDAVNVLAVNSDRTKRSVN